MRNILIFAFAAVLLAACNKKVQSDQVTKYQVTKYQVFEPHGFLEFL
jgi:hypothetical protein